MDEYIDREAALSLIQPDAPEDDTAAITIATAKKLVRSIVYRTPTADVEPVIHAHWIEQEDGNIDTYYTCSACKEDFDLIAGTPCENLYNYCPNCGAKMDETVEDDKQ